MIKDAALAFFVIVTLGLVVIMWREHAPAQQLPLVVEAATPVTCVPPASHWQFRQRRIA